MIRRGREPVTRRMTAQRLLPGCGLDSRKATPHAGDFKRLSRAGWAAAGIAARTYVRAYSSRRRLILPAPAIVLGSLGA